LALACGLAAVFAHQQKRFAHEHFAAAREQKRFPCKQFTFARQQKRFPCKQFTFARQQKRFPLMFTSEEPTRFGIGLFVANGETSAILLRWRLWSINALRMEFGLL